jgi:hypothetical protein
MPQTRSKAKTPKTVQVDDNDDSDDSSASGSSIVRGKIEVSSPFIFQSIHVSFLRVGPYRRGSGGREETKTTY